jgi:hypothetical protein
MFKSTVIYELDFSITGLTDLKSCIKKQNTKNARHEGPEGE